MSKLVTLITPTGCRPEAFALCEKYMSRQTYQGDIRWIVVDDYLKEPTKCTKGQIVIQAELQWRKGINTQRYNIHEAIKYMKKNGAGDYVFVIEDDDWFHPQYIEKMLYFLEKYPFVGQTNSRYYCIKDRMYKQWNNYLHASLVETAFRAEELATFEEGVHSGDLFIDCLLWRIIKDKKIPHHLFEHEGLACGMKQLPGRLGIGAGHNPKEKGFSSDPGFNKLIEWVGREDAQVYINMAMGKK